MLQIGDDLISNDTLLSATQVAFVSIAIGDTGPVFTWVLNGYQKLQHGTTLFRRHGKKVKLWMRRGWVERGGGDVTPDKQVGKQRRATSKKPYKRSDRLRQREGVDVKMKEDSQKTPSPSASNQRKVARAV